MLGPASVNLRKEGGPRCRTATLPGRPHAGLRRSEVALGYRQRGYFFHEDLDHPCSNPGLVPVDLFRRRPDAAGGDNLSSRELVRTDHLWSCGRLLDPHDGGWIYRRSPRREACAYYEDLHSRSAHWRKVAGGREVPAGAEQ